MSASRRPVGSKDVFLNVPFDAAYEKLFVALISTVVAARLVPRCAVELPERGQGQLSRILSLLERCSLSIHDLSRPRRFNMPFELGLAVFLQQRHRHQFIVMESGLHRGTHTPSDLRSLAPILHGNSARKLISRLLDNLGGAKPADAERIYRKLTAVVPAIKADYRVDDIFRKTIFNELVSGAIEEAEQAGMED
jgi:hypothetical protein